MKVYDVHFLIKISDYFGSLEGEENEVKKIAEETAKDPGTKEWLLDTVTKAIEDHNYEIEIIETVYLGEAPNLINNKDKQND